MDLRKKAKNVLFIDIETVSGKASFDQLDERMQEQWERKAANIRNDEHVSPFDLFYRRAAIYSEFGKIICVGHQTYQYLFSFGIVFTIGIIIQVFFHFI